MNISVTESEYWAISAVLDQVVTDYEAATDENYLYSMGKSIRLVEDVLAKIKRARIRTIKNKYKKNKMRISYYEIQELACAVLGLDYDSLCNEGREDEIEKKIYEKLEIDMEQFSRVVKVLLPFTPIVVSGLYGDKYHAFVNSDEGLMIVRQKVEEK